MQDWPSWDKIKNAAQKSLNFARGFISPLFYGVLIILTILYFLYIIVPLYPALVLNKNSTGEISVFIGLISLDIAIYSIISSTKQLKNAQNKLSEIQIDYWNARGIDDNRKGNHLLEQREYDRAIKAYKNAIDAFDKADMLDPLNAKSWSNRGNALVGLRKYDEAIEAFRHATELDPQSPRIRANYGHGLYEKGIVCREQEKFLDAHMNHDSAIDAFRMAIRQNPRLSYAWNGMGAALKDKGDVFKRQYKAEGAELYRSYATAMYDKAIRCYKEAIELDPNFGSFSYNLGLALNEKGNFEDAIKAYDKAIGFDPKNPEIWFGKAEALKNQRKFNEAIHAYNKAIEFKPIHSAVWNQRGKVLVDQALDLIQKNEGHAWLNTNDAIFLQINYNYLEALKSYDMAIDINPIEGMFWAKKSDVLRSLGRIDEAKAAATRARDLGYTANP